MRGCQRDGRVDDIARSSHAAQHAGGAGDGFVEGTDLDVIDRPCQVSLALSPAAPRLRERTCGRQNRNAAVAAAFRLAHILRIVALQRDERAVVEDDHALREIADVFAASPSP